MFICRKKLLLHATVACALVRWQLLNNPRLVPSSPNRDWLIRLFLAVAIDRNVKPDPSTEPFLWPCFGNKMRTTKSCSNKTTVSLLILTSISSSSIHRIESRWLNSIRISWPWLRPSDECWLSFLHRMASFSIVTAPTKSTDGAV